MEQQMPKRLLLGVGLFVASLVSLTLWGCGGSGGTQNSDSGTTVNVVFPQQSATILDQPPSSTTAWQHSTPSGSFAGIVWETMRFYEVTPAYAQVVPSSVVRLELRITGPGILEPRLHDIPLATGRTTVDVPVGGARVFEVVAFPADLPIANFIGRRTVDVPATGTNVTINMESVTLTSIQVTPTNPQIAKGTVQQFTATGVLSDGTVQNLTSSVDWTSSNTNAAVIGNAEGIKGIASGVQEGLTQITATLRNVMNVIGETTLTVTAAEVVEIVVIPPTPSTAIGIRLQFHATGLFTDGTSQDLTLLASWTSSSPAVASINATGRATALAVGSTIISATFQDVIGDTLLNVTPVELAAITVTPAIPSIAVGTRLQFIATGIFTDGSSQDLTNSATWTSSTVGVAVITNPGGLAIAVAEGSTIISATLQNVTGSATLSVRNVELAAITVTPAIPSIAVGTRLQFVATGIYTDGMNQDLTELAIWMSSDPAIATISNAQGSQGLSSAVSAGSTTISATFQSVTGNTVLTVRDVELAAITVTPAIATIAMGTRLRFTATGIFTDGTSQDLTNFATLIASPLGTCAIDPTRRATAVAPGTCTISASFRSLIGTATLTVTAAEVEAITVTPPIPTAAVGTRLQFTGSGLLTDGTSQDLTNSASWTSSPANICAIDPTTGLATALAVGTCTISATFQEVIGDATLTVTAAELEAITVTPAIPTIAEGTMLQFTATGLFTNGTSQDLTTPATWIASPVGICAIDPTGLATALEAGTCTVSATFQGISGDTTLTVSAAVLEAITVTPAIPTIADGTTLQFTATGLFTDGTSQDLTTPATWIASPVGICAIDPTGLATALEAGTCTISATFQGVSGGTTLTVTIAVLEAIIVTSTNPTIAMGTTLQFTATGLFTDGTSQDLTTPATWIASPVGICAIDPTGLATALEAGTCTISATFQGVSGGTTLTVTTAVLEAIIVTPTNATIAESSTLQFTATGIFTNGSSQDLTSSATWASDSGAASVSPTGLVTGLRDGAITATISATSQGITGSTILTVREAELVAIVVTPANPAIALGATLQFTATGFFEHGITQDLTTSATWQSLIPGVVSVSPQGLATALALGDTDITATSQGVSGTTTVSVEEGADLVPVPNSDDSEPEFCQGDQLEISVRNQGTVDAGASTVRVVFNPGGTFLDALIDIAIPPITADSFFDLSVSRPQGCTGGFDCNFTITVDVANNVPEANEGNNNAMGICPGIIE